MNSISRKKSIPQKLIHTVYLITLFMITITGFGQMPVFKRYYIADIPGLGWTAEFFVTHYMHYISAMILIALLTYFLADYLLNLRKTHKITLSGYIRGGILSGLVLSGGLLVFRNLPDSSLAPNFIILLDLTHLGFMAVFFISTIICFAMNKKWTKEG